MKIWTTVFYTAITPCVENSDSITNAQPKLASNAAPPSVLPRREIQVAGQNLTTLSQPDEGVIPEEKICAAEQRTGLCGPETEN